MSKSLTCVGVTSKAMVSSSLSWQPKWSLYQSVECPPRATKGCVVEERWWHLWLALQQRGGCQQALRPLCVRGRHLQSWLRPRPRIRMVFGRCRRSNPRLHPRNLTPHNHRRLWQQIRCSVFGVQIPKCESLLLGYKHLRCRCALKGSVSGEPVDSGAGWSSRGRACGDLGCGFGSNRGLQIC